jgi:Zn finger protein HypA/HybF involved in hydrogenase expression
MTARTLRLASFAALLLLTIAAGPARRVDLAPRRVRGGDLSAFYPRERHGQETDCEQCHSPAGWREVKFPHERTGFALDGAHQKTSCGGCHPTGFEAPTGAACQTCHRDPHAGVLGALCDSCHDSRTWKTTFSAEAHQRTGFPLTGAHASIPCVECHLDVRDRTFAARATVSCAKCHLADFQRSTIGSVDHATLGFGTDCVSCHSSGTFRYGTFRAHDRCFVVSEGPHAAVQCTQCHSTLAGASASGTCLTGTASCVACHTHQCGTTDRLHRNVPGYACADRKCYECHKFARP